jgi:integrase
MTGAGVIRYDGKRGVVWRIKYIDAAGTQNMETLGREADGWTRKKAEAKLRERLVRVEKEEYRKPAAVLFEPFAWRWFDESRVPRCWGPKTVQTYRYATRRLVERFGTMRLADIKTADVNAYVADLLRTPDNLQGLSARTVNLTLTVLHGILDRAVDEKLVASNAASRAKRPKEPRYRPRPLTVAEARAVEAKIADATVRLAFVTMELLGLRIGELRELRWANVDLLGRRLRVADSKTPTGERSVSIPEPLAERLEAHYQATVYRGDADFVLCHPEKGCRMNDNRYRESVHAALRAVGITDRFRPAHDLRVTSATSGVLNNEHTSKLMARHGWTSYDTAKKYIDLAGQVFPEEAEALAAYRLGAVTA